MDTVNVVLAAMNVKLDKNDENLKSNEKNLKAEVKAVKEDVIAKVELVQQQLNKQEEGICRLTADNVEMKKSLDEIMKQLERMTKQTSHEVLAEERKKGIAEGGGMESEPKVVVAGGNDGRHELNSAEMFSLRNLTWASLKQMKECRQGASSVVYNDHIYVTGGSNGMMSWLDSVEKLSLNAVQVDERVVWENVPVELPGRLIGHRSVVYNGRMIVIGGFEGGTAYSDRITEISLVPPCGSELVANMPERRGHHGVAIFGDKILIVGGRKSGRSSSALRSVLMYDAVTKEFQELAPLPYPVNEMATVKWGYHNALILGGVDSKRQPLNNVLMYNIKTQKSFELPNMKYKRLGCVAAVVGDTVIVMGGRDERGDDLKSVESFRFDRNSWEELPPMLEARCWATAVVC